MAYVYDGMSGVTRIAPVSDEGLLLRKESRTLHWCISTFVTATVRSIVNTWPLSNCNISRIGLCKTPHILLCRELRDTLHHGLVSSISSDIQQMIFNEQDV